MRNLAAFGNTNWSLANLEAVFRANLTFFKQPSGLPKTERQDHSAADGAPQVRAGQVGISTMALQMQKDVRHSHASNDASPSGIQLIRHRFKSGKDFSAKPGVVAVIGEGPAGLACVLHLLDKASTSPGTCVKHIVWYKARNERLRRHVAAVDDRTTSIRAMENDLRNRISHHDMRHLLTEKTEKFDDQHCSAGEAKHVFLADGYNSTSRTSIFFDGRFAKPKTSLVERTIVCYTGLQPIDAQLDTGTKTPMSLEMLRKLGIDEPEQFIDLLRLSFAGMIKQNQQQRLENPDIKRFDPYIHGFADIQTFKSQVEQGLHAFFGQSPTPTALQSALSSFDLPPGGIEKYSQPASQAGLFSDFKANVGAFADVVKTEKGDILFVPVCRKHTCFGMQGLSAKDDDTSQTFHLVGNAALGYVPGGPNITEAMEFSKKITNFVMDSEVNKAVKRTPIDLFH